jgi:MerR family transcriptional regulator, mercuric resistance operon regulatory protein
MVQSQGVETLTIGRLAAAGGVGVETVRFYQRKGLLRRPTREAGFRHYEAEDLRRLRFVRQGQTAGFTLAELKELLALDATDDRPRARELARQRISALDAKIEELQRARASLTRLANECAEGATGPCPILASFDV